MNRMKLIGLAFAAVCALSALVAASASAVEWLAKEGGVWKAITTPVATVAPSATLTLKSNGTTLDCTGSQAGTVGAGAADAVNKVENTGKTSIKILCTTLTAGLCEGQAEAEAANLSWATKLEVVAGKTIDKLESGGKGSPGWKVQCGGFFKAKNECTRATALLAVKNNANGTVSLTFNKEEKANCTVGGENSGEVEGTVTIEANQAGVEGIRAE